MVFTAFSSGDSLPVTRGRPGATGFMPSSIEPSVALQALSFIKSGGSIFPPSALSRGTTPAITFVEKPAATIQSGQTVGPHQLMDRAGSLTL